MIGGGFGLIFYFAAYSGVLNYLQLSRRTPGRSELSALLVLAFLAGFSERWAQDTLTSLGQGSGQTDPAGQPAAQAGHS